MTVAFCQVGLGEAGRDDVLWQPVQRRGHGVVRVGDLGPVRLHHVVGRPAEQELVGLVEPRVYDPPKVVVDVLAHR
jgi:hypothetical protein